MRRMMLLTFTWSMLALGVAHAVPARPLYEPPAPPKAPLVIVVDLNGSAWLGKYSAVNRIFIFEADGTLSYKSIAATAKPFKNRGFWKLEGNTLYFEHFIKQGNTIMEFRGTIKDANTIVGESWNKAGVKTPQTLQRTNLELK